MSTVKIRLKNGDEHEFVENTFQHQIGNGAVQIMFKDGGQVVYNDFDKVEVIPSDEERAAFEANLHRAEEQAEANLRLAEEALKGEQDSANDAKGSDEEAEASEVAH